MPAAWTWSSSRSSLQLMTQLACEIGIYTIQMTPPDGVPIVDRGKYVLVHERGPEGTWLRAIHMFNPEVPVAHVGPSHPPSPSFEGGLR